MEASRPAVHWRALLLLRGVTRLARSSHGRERLPGQQFRDLAGGHPAQEARLDSRARARREQFRRRRWEELECAEVYQHGTTAVDEGDLTDGLGSGSGSGSESESGSGSEQE